MENDIVTELYTDGSAIENPGRAGWSFIIKYYEIIDDKPPVKKLVSGSGGFRRSTNSRMEMTAIIEGLTKLMEMINLKQINTKRVKVLSDSEFICKSINYNWILKWIKNKWIGSLKKPIKNKDLWLKIHSLIYDFKIKQIELTVEWIKGHANFEYNELADHLAKDAALKATEIDQEYEKINKK